LSYEEAIELSRVHAPQIEVARRTEYVAEADARVAGLYPNPTVLAGTNSQVARLSVGASVPLLILGQRGAAIATGRAEYRAAKIDTEVIAADVRAAAAHAFVALWAAEHAADARERAVAVALRLERAVQGRVELGSAPAMEALRSRSELLRTQSDAALARQMVESTSAELALWINRPSSVIRTRGSPSAPERVPPLSELGNHVDDNPSVRRALAEVSASFARVRRERAQVRPLMTLEVGADLWDPTLPGTNYRAQLGVEVPLFNQRGPLIEREQRRAAAAQAQAHLERIQTLSALIVAYRNYAGLTRQRHALADSVLPAAEAAAQASEESYVLGRAPLVSVLEAARTRIETELQLLDAMTAQANAWIDLEHALGVR
jgi:cobalt-zinc-cadmium efflux system outer membrane protein